MEVAVNTFPAVEEANAATTPELFTWRREFAREEIARLPLKVELAAMLSVVEAAPRVITFKRLAPVPILTALALVAPVAMFTVVAPDPTPRLRMSVWVEEAMVMVPVWLVSPMTVIDEEALFRVRAPSEVREVESSVRVA